MVNVSLVYIVNYLFNYDQELCALDECLPLTLYVCLWILQSVLHNSLGDALVHKVTVCLQLKTFGDHFDCTGGPQASFEAGNKLNLTAKLAL